MRALRADAKASGTEISNALNNSISTNQAARNITALSGNLTTLANVAKTPASSFKAAADSISANLGDLAKKAGLSEKEFSRLNERMLRTTAANNAANSLKHLANSAGLSTREAQKLARQMGFTDAEAKKMTRSMDGAERSGKGMSSSFATLGRTLVGLFGTYQLVQFGKELVRTADTYTLLRNQLRLVTGSTEELNSTQARLQKLAADTRVGFEPTLKIYTRMARATQELGVSSEDLMTVTQALNESVILSGASSQEANAALIQLSQGMASGQLRGEELRSVMEQLPAVAMQIAKGMDIPYAKFREMAFEGKVTTEAMIDALKKQSGEIHTQFSTMALTVGQAWTNVGTNWGAVVDDMNRSLTGTGGIAGTMQWWADWLRNFHESGDATAWADAMGAAGISLASGIQLSFMDMSYSLETAFEHVRYAWDLLMSGMQEEFAEYVRFVSEGYKAIPFIGDEIANTWIGVADSMRTTSQATAEHQTKMQTLRAEYTHNRKVIEDVAFEMSGLGDKGKEAGNKTEKAFSAAGVAVEDFGGKTKDAWDIFAEGEAKIKRIDSMVEQFYGSIYKTEDAFKALDKQVFETGQSYDVMVAEWQSGNDVLTRNIADTSDLIEDDFSDMTGYIEDRWKEAYDGMQGILADWIKDGEISFDSVKDMFMNMLAEMAAAWIMNMGRMALGNLISSFGGSSGWGTVLGAIGTAISGGSSGGGSGGSGGGAAGGALGLAGTGYQLYAGESIWATMGGYLGLGGEAAAGGGAAAGGAAAGGGAAATGTGAAATGTAATGTGTGTASGGGGGAAAGAGIGTAAVASVFAIGISLWASQMMKEDIPPLSELLNKNGIGPDAFAYAIGDTFKNGMDPIFGTMNAFMMDSESLILTKSNVIFDGIRRSSEGAIENTMMYFNAAEGGWQDLTHAAVAFEMQSKLMGKELAAASIEAKMGIKGLGAELLDVADASRTGLDYAIEGLVEMGIEGEELRGVLDAVNDVLTGSVRGTTALEDELRGLGLASDQIANTISNLGLDMLSVSMDIGALSNSVDRFAGGMTDLDYSLYDIEVALSDLTTTARDAGTAIGDAAYDIQDAIDGIAGGGGAIPPPSAPPGYSPPGTVGTNNIKVEVYLQGNDIIDSKKLNARVALIADQNRVAAARRSNMSTRRIVQ